MPSQYQFEDEPGSVKQAVEVFAESQEISPYATDFKPPYPQAMIPGYSGYAASGSGFGFANGKDGGSSSQVPDSYDLTWVASDTAEFSFFFQNVCWTPTIPSPAPTVAGITWEMVHWMSQVRSAWSFYYGYWWPPVFPLGRYIMSFTVTATYVENDPDLGTGTMVTLNGGTMWPGDFLWDLQADTYPDPVNMPDFYTVRTWLSGKAKVLTQVSSPQLYPPSNWPVAPYA